MTDVCRVRVPRGDAMALAYGQLDGVPVIFEGDRHVFRAIGEALSDRLQPVDLAVPIVILAAGQEACESCATGTCCHGRRAVSSWPTPLAQRSPGGRAGPPKAMRGVTYSCRTRG